MQARLIINPAAGRGRRRRTPEEVSTCLERAGIPHDVCPTTAPGSAVAQAREAALEGVPVVIAAGGDGTVHEALNGLVGTKTALGILPLGTENICARSLGMPFDLDAACARLAAGSVRTVDVGRVGGRCFLSIAGIGLDATVVSCVSPGLKRRMRTVGFFLTGLWVWSAYEPTCVQVESEGKVRERRIWAAVVGNGPLYAWRVRVSPNSRLDDGLLDVCLFTQPSRWQFLVAALESLASHSMRCEHWQARRLALHTPEPVPVQLDGEPVTLPDLVFEAVPHALRVLA